MKIRYVGPHDAVEVAGLTVGRGKTIDVPDEVAGTPPVARLAVAMTELAAATAVRDHPLQAELRAEIAELDYGTGLLAQDTWEAVTSPPAATTKKAEVDK